MVNKTRIAALILLPVILLPAAGCARNKAKGDTAYVARDVNTLYSLAKDRADGGNMSSPPSCSTKSSANIPTRSGPAARS